jgi:propanol-preferring alcohol dehydrogenase
MHGYDQPLILEDIRIPEIRSNEVLVKVGGTGMCRSDVQLIDGYFRTAKEYDLPITLGHEIAGRVDAIGDDVPSTALLTIGDHVVVSTGWGDGTCRQCRLGISRSVHTERGRGSGLPADTRSTSRFRISI